jgi:hypothetical protein
MEPLLFPEEPRTTTEDSPILRAENVVAKLKAATEMAQAAMAAAQQAQEEQSNRHRDPASHYKVGDKVWLDLRNVKTDRPSKKLDNRNAKFTVIKQVGSHSYELDTPPGIHPVFHTNLLRPAASDPLPSQRTTDWQPPAIIVEGGEEYEIDKILGERTIRRGRGSQHQYRVKWTGYAQPTWTPAQALADTAALERYEASHTTGGEVM